VFADAARLPATLGCAFLGCSSTSSGAATSPHQLTRPGSDAILLASTGSGVGWGSDAGSGTRVRFAESRTLMHSRIRSALIHTCVIAFAVSAVAATLERHSPASAAQVVRHTHALGSAQHLYVSDPYEQRVLRFPLNAGIPAQQPDAIISGLRTPLGLAIGPNDGRLYLVDVGLEELLIFEPAPTGSSKPSHVLALPRHGKAHATVAVDKSGLVYLGLESRLSGIEPSPRSNVVIFAPLPSGTQRPMATIRFGYGTGPFGLAVSPEQRLAASLGGSNFIVPILAFAAPVPRDRDTSLLRCASNVPFGVAWDASNVLYIADQGTNGGRAQIEVVPQSPHGCGGEYAITSSTVPLSAPQGIAVNGGLLYASNAFEGSAGSALVFVFDPTIKGAQKPKAVLGGPSLVLRSAWGVAVGP
jgi:hypothetical protein